MWVGYVINPDQPEGPHNCTGPSMKLSGQEELEASHACDDVPVGQPDGDPGSDPSPSDPLNTGSRDLGVPKDLPLFIQLNELLGWPQTLEWRETGR